ncbi:gluconokinase [Planosporangium thailandense]|uniref:Gluconokinase n=2 Tax=Planosporangium thailandense TaxID=765197 RepID=A0ABX0XZ48_9ACTN|nr:gluconokinase [Planosporangium thailandense]
MTSPQRSPPRVMIGLDVGTTAAKAVAFGLDSDWRRLALREYPVVEPVPGWYEQDPERIAECAAAALAECVAGVGDAEVLGISVSAAMHGLIGLDAVMRPVTRLVIWADSRADGEARALRTDGQAAELHRHTGIPVHPMTPLTKLMWFARHDRRTCAAARWWFGLKDYLLWRLTGTLATDLSSAGGTGMLDLATRTWSPAAVELAGISAEQLPSILPTTATLTLAATAASRIGLPAGTPVVAGAADGPLGNLGTGAVSPGVAGLSLGTSGAVRMVIPEPKVDDRGTLFCYALTDSAWVVGGAISNGGLVVRWAGRALTPDLLTGPPEQHHDEEVLDLAATAPAGSDGLVVLPYLVAERAPLWDPDLPGAILGLRAQHTRAHLIRAAVEGVCLQLRAVVDQLDRLWPVTAVRATGGTFRAALWRETMAAVLARPLTVVGEAEGTALGAAALGLVALGHATRLGTAAARLSPPDAAPESPVEAPPDLVATYARLRASLPGLVRGLESAAGALAPTTPAAAAATRSAPAPAPRTVPGTPPGGGG